MYTENHTWNEIQERQCTNVQVGSVCYSLWVGALSCLLPAASMQRTARILQMRQLVLGALAALGELGCSMARADRQEEGGRWVRCLATRQSMRITVLQDCLPHDIQHLLTTNMSPGRLHSLSNWEMTACATVAPSLAPSSTAWRKCTPPYTRESFTSSTACGKVGSGSASDETRQLAATSRLALQCSLQCSAAASHGGAHPARSAAHLLDAVVGAGCQAGELGANLKGSVGAKELGNHRARRAGSGGVACEEEPDTVAGVSLTAHLSVQARCCPSVQPGSMCLACAVHHAVFSVRTAGVLGVAGGVEQRAPGGIHVGSSLLAAVALAARDITHSQAWFDLIQHRSMADRGAVTKHVAPNLHLGTASQSPRVTPQQAPLT